ncbi:MAG: lysine biosynthesis protein LysW [bacterium]|nr:lysine biosynthesis protein LysW [bacterium]
MMFENVDCPFCEAEVALATDTVKDELLECADCGVELMVTSIDPLHLEEAPQAEEDWGQ